MQINKHMMVSQQEQQRGELMQQLEMNRRQSASPVERENKIRLDILKQKDKTSESAVASPEV